ncbi:hypothetical protein BU25DRAFT_272384 [Macroventuria anomochaeta]|uniref:Uncharacterized protein n=1 Tax=Macroventuria anomochaeta TaxID=301207 RepID=A0ACB6S920_9PLEO|nr:uncharacterized protein BU25DRAFT_272384 [Macroventuria anomochaeta]KAF2629709.1 hypothetical protein BU25DRAFT_272384 [Macroventuria anomochaeta]
MGDIAPPPLEAASSNDELASKGSELSTTSPAGSDKTLTPPRLRSTSNVEPQLGGGSAMFSTDLGRRAPRRFQSPPYAPVLVRSDIVRDVVTAAGYWRSKYPHQYLCIFPRAGWQIGDLWDKEDVHRETEPFCKEVLRFIERDNCVRAQNYVQDWSKLHPERLPIVGGDMTELYDKSNPLSVVDKIFVNEERRQYPPIFLWHVAHIMRTTMLTVKGAKLPVKKPSVPERLDTGHKDPVAHGTAPIPATVEGTAILPVASSTTATSSTHVVNPAASMSGQQPIPAWHSDRTSPPFLSDAPPAHGRFADPIEGGGYTETVGHMMPGVPGHEVGGPNAAHSGLHVPRNRSARSASGTYNQTVPSGLYVENMPRAPSGHGPRQHANTIPMTQSPRFNQAHMTLNHPMVKIHHGIIPFAHEQARMTPGMIAGQAHAPGVMHPGMMPPHAMQNPSMTHGYSRQPSGLQSTPYAGPMGDVTNMHYSPGMPSQNIDPRHPGDRRFSQQHGNGSALYDPYEGSNPAFRTVGYSNGKKYSQNSLHNSTGRQRKTSFPGSRPYHGQYTNDRPGLLQMGGNRFFGPKPDREDDPAITQDQEYGCYIDWIGPRNETVNELFVKDLPENIQDAELEALFLGRLGVKPTSVKVKSAEHAQYAQGRKHAFVGSVTYTHWLDH